MKEIDDVEKRVRQQRDEILQFKKDREDFNLKVLDSKMQEKIEKLIQLENPLRKLKLRTLFPCVEYICCCCRTEKPKKKDKEKEFHDEVCDDESQVKNDALSAS